MRRGEKLIKSTIAPKQISIVYKNSILEQIIAAHIVFGNAYVFFSTI